MKRFILALILIATPCFASGLYQETTTPIAGEVITYRRAPYVAISNPLDKPITVEMTMEQVKLFPDGSTVTSFARRNTLSSTEFSGKNIPLIHPATGQQIGYMTTDQYYLFTYSLMILSEKKADNQIFFAPNDPATVYYTTQGLQ